MPKTKIRYRTFSFLPVLSGFVVFISTIIVAMTSIAGPRPFSVNGYVTVISRGQSEVPVVVATVKNQRSTFEVVGTKSIELIARQGQNFLFTGKLTGISGTYGLQFEVSSYTLPLK